MSHVMRRGSAVLGLFLVIGAAVVVALGVTSAQQLGRTSSAAAASAAAQAGYTFVQYRPDDSTGADGAVAVQFIASPADSVPSHARAVAAQAQRSVPTIALGAVMLALFAGIVLAAARGGVYTGTTRRLLRIGGLAALIGGPAAVGIEALTRGTDTSDGLPWWAQLSVWLLLGSALLAAGELLGRAGEMRAELSEVI